eukprot:CAMPEP_0115345132 /NCGR_PEP_ID=MMETSP0270-20121206/93657_1 /TAXON_ID=71861 /ORGANISM="Scrippsiella trochoidea, Strain CCMP3099" /LENGTH=211 /DNA_ID=CAMNT_0002766913 /DNA_START=34 /DNA_END=671 /DNA_ORIENTATION=+
MLFSTKMRSKPVSVFKALTVSPFCPMMLPACALTTHMQTEHFSKSLANSANCSPPTTLGQLEGACKGPPRPLHSLTADKYGVAYLQSTKALLVPVKLEQHMLAPLHEGLRASLPAGLPAAVSPAEVDPAVVQPEHGLRNSLHAKGLGRQVCGDPPIGLLRVPLRHDAPEDAGQHVPMQSRPDRVAIRAFHTAGLPTLLASDHVENHFLTLL